MKSPNSNLQNEKSDRIVLFADLRDSTDILINFEQDRYKKTAGPSVSGYSYEKFILNLHETIYKELYLGHEYTYGEIYGDGVVGVFPEDNAKYILENVYRLASRMRINNDLPGVGVSSPKIDIGFGITVGRVSFVYYPFDKQDHPVGQSIHEAARIEGVSKFYDARVLVSHRFLSFAESFLTSDPRFSYRFIDQVVLRGFREPLTLFELLLDNDPRFDIKTNSIQEYSKGYSKYREGKWKEAKEIFLKIYHEYGLGIGGVMAKRCDILAASPPSTDWNAIWKLGPDNYFDAAVFKSFDAVDSSFH